MGFLHLIAVEDVVRVISNDTERVAYIKAYEIPPKAEDIAISV